MVALLSGCNTAPKSDSGKSDLESRADAAVARFKTSDPTLSGFFGKAVGYAVFPNVGKGGFGVGGAYGKGVYYEGGKAVGYCDLSQGSIGFQLGGQVYSELVFFETAGTAKDFKEGHVEFSAQASAVAANKGAGANADYDHGVAVFTLGEKGLMYEASIGGQKFSYQAK
ncbi:MAG: hypothetical protein GC159_23290 [Phycisphaera sp.]|nr:hypothetical protein [Phycisphaera sp.]